MEKFDYLVVGSGLYGAIFAHEAKAHGKSVLVVDKRPNIAGNIYTENVEGINVHKYGAHIFHTNNKNVWNYITQFAEFNRFTNSPVANYKGELYSLPFNMYTLIKNKTTRLLIPFLLVSVFYSFPLKYISGYWKGTESVIKDFFVGQILLQGNTYLWFLPALFILFLLFYVIIKANMLSSMVLVGGVLLNFICDNPFGYRDLRSV